MSQKQDVLFPASVGKEIVARIGLMSDTHMPDRLAKLPAGLWQAFAGVDFILHAGDVGELWVLDELSTIAPVIAVHGNDETADATRELPYKQVVTVAGQRILVWHSHYQDRIDEMASRQDETLLPKLERIAAHGRRAGARIVFFSHWHIPLTYQFEDLFLINAGTFASGSWFTRARHQTAALLQFYADGSFETVHIDLAAPSQPFTAAFDVSAGFRAAAAPYEDTIITAALQTRLPAFWAHELADKAAVVKAILRLGHRCWSGELDHYGRELLLAEILNDTHIDPADQTWARSVLE
ncbi:MAG: YfcE family phosphodiesterase [Anaerolineales bacterium]|nr:YfcE family phosphodiesterase [Anaerolineales bacterium]